MTRKSSFKLLGIFTAGVVLLFAFQSLVLVHKMYNGIFRLTSKQITSSLIGHVSQCTKLSDCKLLPGDILIRRYITSRTLIVDKFAHPYFTHSAFYLGEDQLVEAVGTEKNSKDDIQVDILSKSDWLNSDINNFVIIRPKNYLQKLELIKKDLIGIAEDPEYIFGLPHTGNKKTTCADLIFKQLTDKKIIDIPNRPDIITPDYLFWIATNNPDDFEIIGYNISE